MKKVLVLFPFLLSFLCGEAQVTTETEYNYMKKGYRQVAESGLDVKQGYEVEELPMYENDPVTIYSYKLKRTDGTLAGIILKTVSTETFGSGTNWYAIPSVNTNSGNSYGWKLFYSDLELMSTGMRFHVIKWMAYRLVYEMNK